MKIFLIALTFTLLTGCNSSSDTNDLNVSNQYCEMWKIWHDSDGEYGWPDTKNAYKDEC